MLNKLGNLISGTQTDINTSDGYSDLFQIGSYPLVAPNVWFYNGATYVSGMGLDADNNAPKVFKYKDGLIEYAFVGDIDNNDPLTHNHPAVIVIGGFVYILVVNGHGQDIKIFKGNVSESIIDGFTLHHTITTDVGYLNAVYNEDTGVMMLHCRTTSGTPNYSSKVFYSAANDFTSWTARTITTAQDGVDESYYGWHYPQNVEHYGTNINTYIAINARYNLPTPKIYWSHYILKTTDFDNWTNLDETTTTDLSSSTLSQTQLFNYLVAGDKNAPFKYVGGANYITINDVIFGSYYDFDNGQYKFTRTINGTTAEFPVNLPYVPTNLSTDISQFKLLYNGNNIIVCIRHNQVIGVCDLNFDNQQTRLELFDNKTGQSIVSYELPTNMQDVDSEYIIAGSDGFEGDATEGIFYYQVLDDRFLLDLDVTNPSEVTNLSASETATSVNLTWTAASANTYPVNRYAIYIDGVLTDRTASTSYTAEGLNSGQYYSFEVETEDIQGNTSEKVLVNATTLDDPYNDVAVAFSLREIFTWDNAVLKLRRNSDNQQAWVFFDSNGTISTANSLISTTSNTTPSATTLGSWVSTSNALVVEWIGMTTDNILDSANVVNNTTTSTQPRLIQSGNINTVNGDIAIDFQTKRTELFNTTGLAAFSNTNFTVFTVSSRYDDSANNLVRIVVMSTRDGVGGSTGFLIYNDKRSNKRAVNWINTTPTAHTADLTSAQSLTETADILITGVKQTSNVVSYKDGTLQNTVALTGTMDNNGLYIGNDGNATTTNYLHGHIKEIIVYGSDKTADISDIHTDINSHYTIY